MFANNPKICFILTGGTIDSRTKGQERDVLLEHSLVPNYVKNLNLPEEFEFNELFLKDSRDITEEDRELLLSAIRSSHSSQIIITHGTFTMAETGKFLKINLLGTDKTVVLTGAMTPLVFENSDAADNLQFSIEQVKKLTPGVYICMHGQVFDPGKVVKDEVRQKFYSLS